MREPQPVITDTTLYRAFTRLYGIFVATGVVAAFALPPSLIAVGGHTLTMVWILSLAAVSAFSLVFSTREQWGRREMISSSILLALLLIYSTAICINTVANLDLNKAVSAVFSLSFSVFVEWRVRSLFKRYRKPRG